MQATTGGPRGCRAGPLWRGRQPTSHTSDDPQAPAHPRTRRSDLRCKKRLWPRQKDYKLYNPQGRQLRLRSDARSVCELIFKIFLIVFFFL